MTRSILRHSRLPIFPTSQRARLPATRILRDARPDSSTPPGKNASQDHSRPPRLTHVDATTGAAHMVDVAHKQATSRAARARCALYFSDDTAPRLIRENGIQKGDVLGVARIAGIMAAKRTAEWIPLCHPLMLSHVSVELTPVFGRGQDNRIDISAQVRCDGKTGVEMEALTAASAAALTVYDMCKAVDKGMRVEGLRLVSKVGGKSGPWGEAHGEGEGSTEE